MLTGEVPFKGESAEEVIAMQVLKTLDAAILKSRGASPFVHFLLQKMMAKDRADRYQHPTEVIKEILDQAGDVSDAVRPTKKKFTVGGATGDGPRVEGKSRRGRRAGGRKPGRRRKK